MTLVSIFMHTLMCTCDVQLGSPMAMDCWILAAEPAWIIFSSLRTGLSLVVHTGNCSCIFGRNACYTLCMRCKVAIISNWYISEE